MRKCRGKKDHGRRKNNKHFVNCKNAEELIDTIDKFYASQSVGGIYSLLRRSSVKLIEKAISCTNTYGCKFKETKCCLQAYNSQFVKVKHTKPEKKAFLKIQFQHKSIEDIHLNTILHSSEIRNTLPEAAKHIKICVTYSYQNTIGRKILNYNKVLKNVKHSDLKQKYSLDDCDCMANYTNFIDHRLGHVHTGKLEIIQDESLRSIMKYGANYREVGHFDRKHISENIFSGIDDLVSSLAKACSMKSTTEFNEFQEKMKKRIKDKLESMKYVKYNKPVLNERTVRQNLEKLHNRFVIVQVDKAANNFAIICKNYYLNILDKELIGNSSYQKVSKDEATICSEHKQYLKKTFGIKLSDKEMSLPLMYWTSKQHKDPFKQRYVTGAYKCTTSQISIDIQLILKSIKLFWKNFCGVIRKRTGRSTGYR